MRKTFWLNYDDAVLVADLLIQARKKRALEPDEEKLLSKLSTWILRTYNSNPDAYR